MIVQGTLQTNSDIFFSMDPNPLQSNVSQMNVENPSGAVYTFVYDSSVNYGTWKLNTQTPGDYRVNAYRELSTGGGESDFVDFTIVSNPNVSISQTHTYGAPVIANCANVGITVTTSVLMSQIQLGTDPPIAVSPNATVYTIDRPRGTQIAITVTAADLQYGENTKQSSQTFFDMVPVYATGTYLDVTVLPIAPPSQAAYSYDFGVGYQPSNEYHYTTAGTKIINVQDSLGCIQIIQFEAEALPSIDPLNIPLTDFISKGNSLRFIEVANFDDCTVYKTDENTPDCETDYLNLKYFYNQKLKKCNDYTTQIKASYDTYEANLYLVETDEIVIPLQVDLVQENLDVTSSLPYNRYDDPTYSYIYFSDGNQPYYYQVGGGLTVNGEARAILEFVYNEELDTVAAKIILLTVGLGGTADYNYNKQDYNVYEFVLPATTLPIDLYYITLTMTKDIDVKNFKTPIFEINESYDRTADILYFSDTNTDIYYGNAIQNFLTVGLDSRAPIVSSELEIVTGDATNYLKSSFNVEKFEYVFEPMTLENMRKLVYALSNQRLFINSVGYVGESIDIQVPEANTNFYVVTATLVKANENFRFISGSGGAGYDWSSTIITFDSTTVTFDASSV